MNKFDELYENIMAEGKKKETLMIKGKKFERADSSLSKSGAMKIADKLREKGWTVEPILDKDSKVWDIWVNKDELVEGVLNEGGVRRTLERSGGSFIGGGYKSSKWLFETEALALAAQKKVGGEVEFQQHLPRQLDRPDGGWVLTLQES
jgi:hypothetical protein